MFLFRQLLEVMYYLGFAIDVFELLVHSRAFLIPKYSIKNRVIHIPHSFINYWYLPACRKILLGTTGLYGLLSLFARDLRRLLPTFEKMHTSIPGNVVDRRALEEKHILFKLLKILEFYIANALEDTKVADFEEFETRYTTF